MTLGGNDAKNQLTLNTDGSKLLLITGNGPVISSANLYDLTDPTNPTSSKLFDDGLLSQIGSVVVGAPFWPVTVSQDFSTIAFREETSAAANLSAHGTARVVVRDLDGTHPRYYGDVLPVIFNNYNGGWNPGSGPLRLDVHGDTLLYTANDADVATSGPLSAYVAATTSSDSERLVTRDDVGNERAVTDAWLNATGDGVAAWIHPLYAQTYGDGGILAGTGDGQPDAGLFYSSADTQAPTWPANAALTADGVGATQVTLHWPAATDDKGLTGYVITGGPTQIAVAGDATSRTVTGLTPGTAYHFSIIARDAGGNSTSPLEVDVTTPTSVTPGTAPLAVKANSDGTVSLTWDAATGVSGYRVQRAVVSNGTAGSFATLATVGATPVTYIDTTADGVTTYRYVVQKIVGGGDPQPHTVTTDVATVAVSVTGVSAERSLLGGELKYGGSMKIQVVGQPHRTGTATVHYSDSSAPPAQHTASAPVTESNVPGRYTASVPLPTDAASVQSVSGKLTDSVGTGAGHVAERSTEWTADVGGRLDVTVPSAQAFTGVLAISSDSNGFATTVAVTPSKNSQTLSAYVPAAPDYVLRVLDEGGTNAQTLTGISVGHGQLASRTTISVDAATLAVHLGADGGHHNVSLYTPFRGNQNREADSAGNVTFTELRVGDAGVLSVLPKVDDPCGMTLPTNLDVSLAAGDNDISPDVTAPAPATVSGTVTTSDGSLPGGAQVTVTQSCDGQSRNVTAWVGSDGSYSASGLAAGLATRVTAIGSGDDYAAASSDLGELAVGTNHQNLQLVPTSDYHFSISLHTQLGSQPPVDVAMGWQDLVHYFVNVQVGRQYPQELRTDGGTGIVHGVPGQLVTLCADGAQGGYGKGCSSVPLPAQGQPVALDLTLHAAAQLAVTPAVGSVAGQPVQLTGSEACSPKPCTPQHTMSAQLYSGRVWSVALPAEGTWDFTFSGPEGAIAHRTVSTGNGKADLGTVALKVADAFSSTSDNTLDAATNQTVPGGTIQLTAHWRANKAVSGTGTLAVTLPHGTSAPASNAVTVNGTAIAGYSAANGVLQIPVGTIAQNVTGTAVVYLNVSSDTSDLPSDGALGIDAELKVGTITADLGSVQVQLGSVSLNAPGTTGNLTIAVSGRATPGAHVTLLEASAEIGSAVASPGGFWQTQLALPDLGQGYQHQLIAQIGSGANLKQSAPATVTYDKFQPALKTLTLSQGHGNVTVPAGSSFPYVVVPGQPLAVSTTVANPDTVADPAFVIMGTSYPATRSGDVFSATVPASEIHVLDANAIDFDYTKQVPDATTPSAFAGPIPTAAQSRAAAGPVGTFIGNPSVLLNTDSEKKVTAPLTNGMTGSTTVDYKWAKDTSFSTTGLTKLLDGVYADKPNITVSGLGPSPSSNSGTIKVTGHLYLTGRAAAAAARKHHLRRRPAAPVPLGPVVSGYELVFNVGSAGFDLYDAAGAGDKYSQAAKLRGDIDSYCGDKQFDLDREADKILAEAVAKDTLSASLAIAGLVLAPETFGLGTIAVWAASALIDYGMDAYIDSELKALNDTINQECKRPDDKDPYKPHPRPRKPPPGSGDQPGGYPTPIWDPSGTVYDGPVSSPLSGARVTILRSNSADGPWHVWDADDYDQGPNPEITGGKGSYGWDVPEGWYEISASADGHLNDLSQPLHVLPPRTGIDLMLPSAAPPSVTAAVANSDGTITLSFGTWMRAALLSDKQITVTDSAGDPVPASVTPTGTGDSPDGDLLTKTLRVTPSGQNPALSQVLHVHVDGAVQDAAGRPMGSDVTKDVTTKAKTTLTASASKQQIAYGKAVTLHGTLRSGSKGLSGQQLTLQRLPAGRQVWASVKTLATNAEGSVALSVKPTTSTKYRWSYAGSSRYAEVISAARTVRVAQKVNVSSTAKRIKHAAKALVRIYGWATPSVTGEKITLQSYVKGKWRSAGHTVKTKRQRLPNGQTRIGYLIVVPARAKGTFTYRVAGAATKTNAAGYSAKLRIKVV